MEVYLSLAVDEISKRYLLDIPSYQIIIKLTITVTIIELVTLID